MKVELIECTPNPLRVVYLAARCCYSNKSVTEKTYSEDEMRKLVTKVIKSGHHSVIEHISFTFSLEGMSRAASHQLVRHRIASFSQQSQRYVKMDEPDYVIPPEIEKNDYMKNVFIQSMDEAWLAYNALIELGTKAEDARFVLPNACTTNIVMTMNARELFHLFEARLCNRAQWEIRAIVEKMYAECMEKAPDIFKFAGAPCQFGKCKEETPCGKPKPRLVN